jgi:hypothetical protein
MTWQSSGTDLARLRSCLVSHHALPLDMYAPQEQFPLYLPGAGVIAGRFSAFSGSSWNRWAMEYICLFFFWLALSLLCRKKKTGYFLFFPLFFLSLSFFVAGGEFHYNC